MTIPIHTFLEKHPAWKTVWSVYQTWYTTETERVPPLDPKTLWRNIKRYLIMHDTTHYVT